MITEITITWCIEDVETIAPDLTREQCSRVLEYVDKYHDCESGISWSTLEWWASVVRKDGL